MKVVRGVSQDTEIKGWRLVEEKWVATYNSQKWHMNKTEQSLRCIRILKMKDSMD